MNLHDSHTAPSRSLRRPRIIVALCLTLALLASACGGSDQDDETADTTEATAASDSASVAADSGDSDSDSGSDDDEAMADEEDAMEATEEATSAERAEAPAEAATDGEARFAPANPVAPETADQAADEAAADEDRSDSDDAEGLFAPPEPEPSRLIDNRFADYGYREFIETSRDPLSTFALDVDTGSWTVARRWINEGVLPPPEAVRVEEFVNAFDYDYDTPRRGLDLTIEGGPSPFDRDNWLVRVGVQGAIVADEDRPPVALTFVIDTSGSMDRGDRLGLVKESLSTLVRQLDDDDTVAIVVYSDGAGTVLEPTDVRNERDILDAIDSLRPGGSTNLESGLREGYELADDAFRSDGINRVIIASDGVANAGITDVRELSGFIRSYADNDIQLVTVGYGMGNFNDEMMEQLADNGDGFYAYVDTTAEADRLFRDELTSTLVTVAIDSKIQVAFDTDVVASYRLIGFENRGVRDDDFRNDSVDAGELGSGHQVTAMYEVELHRDIDVADWGSVGSVALRWEDPDTGEVIEIDDDIDLRDVAESFGDATPTFRLATVVTAFAEVLRDNPYADDVELTNVAVEARRVADEFDSDEITELADLIDRADDLS